MGTERVHRVALIGAGPRGTSVLERLLAHARVPHEDGDGGSRGSGVPAAGQGGAPGAGRDSAPETSSASGAVRLHIDVIDPYPPGSGHVWNPEQSRRYLMNTPALFPTLSPGELLPVKPVAGLTFNQWRVMAREQLTLAEAGGDDQAGGEAAKAGTAEPAGEDGVGEVSDRLFLSAEDAEELMNLEAADFPSRALYGRYLQWMVAALLAHAGANVAVQVHQSEASRLVPAEQGGYGLELLNGAELQADSVVLAVGHLQAELRPDQQLLLKAAARHGLRYWPPAVPADVDWSALPADEPVLIRGLGLNFFDVMIELSEGRGGHFVATGEGPGLALRYESSGNEPIIYAASRRGTPYRAKAVVDGYIPDGAQLRFCTQEQAGRFAAAGVLPAFDHDLWPLLHRDALWTYYTTLARVSPSSFRHGPQRFLAALDEILLAPHRSGRPWGHRADRLIDEQVEPGDRLKLRQLARPFAGRTFASHEQFDLAVLGHLQADAWSSAAGQDSPQKMAIGALNAGRAVIKEVVADGGLTDASWLGELRGWFEPFVEGLASGPPASRIEQLAALARAGVVHFLGPDPTFHVDEKAGLFSAGSPWVKGGPVTAAHLLEAMMPSNRVLDNVSPLLSQLLRDGLVRPKTTLAFDDAPEPGSGLDVTAPPYRLRQKSGQPHAGMYTLGLQLSSVQWGTAIAAQAGGSLGSGARTLKDADDIAADILARAAAAPDLP